jgi:ribosomal protein S1
MPILENSTIKKNNDNDRVYCQEDYAQELYDLMCGMIPNTHKLSKDVKAGEVYEAEILSVTADGKVIAQTNLGQSILLDSKKEHKFFKDGFAVGSIINVLIESTFKGDISGSAEKAHIAMIKKDLMESLHKQHCAYSVKVKEITNNSGFIVDLSGIDCFLPGSLAAANKITNFEDYVGKELVVMIESYIEQTQSFVVSHKKYIQKILPSKVEELTLTTMYSGNVTGVAPYGCFVEWDGIFTGLLHSTELETDLKSIRTGDTINFFVKKIDSPNKIILTQKEKK